MTHEDIKSALETAYSALTSIPKDHECFRFQCETRRELERAINHVNEVWARVESHEQLPEEELVKTSFSKMLGNKS